MLSDIAQNTSSTRVQTHFRRRKNLGKFGKKNSSDWL
jgi:hypothetical protein